ncbi:AraC family transcriptional regulator [Sinorhizobium numidicum]|uniref:AraC family transcriptional regulator n=1 Tax=Sinorhizobium numidicum TaxID=680248 RepID=A0ABY8CUL2_9HYPH|nr:AraC family transcriptional regulator [Sinorhizobium numidicum]WEX78943.1 AraC family transcriptional regulator [Sinorhizobium numidicum]WEX82339.1 AraC family transcriptional regulator [Sinorhizobium numidicum]
MTVVKPPVSRATHGADPLSDVLRTVKLMGALFFLVDASFPWGVEVPHTDAFSSILLPRAQHVVSYHIILKGSGWATIPNVASTWFEAGDILVFAHGDPYAMLSAPDQPPEFDAAATLDFFQDMASGKLPFVIREGGGGEPRSEFVCGYLGCDMRPFNPLLSTLPRLLRVKRPDTERDDLLGRLIDLTLAEARRPRVGGESIRLRLAELIFVEVVRQYLETLPSHETGWLSGLRDPVIGKVLGMLHEEPAHPWTLNELARRAGMSRAALAARFAHLIGHAPMQYLTLWRMQIAARLLAESSMKVAAVAHEVGYESDAAFSRAFKKIVGVSPAIWRDNAVASN